MFKMDLFFLVRLLSDFASDTGSEKFYSTFLNLVSTLRKLLIFFMKEYVVSQGSPPAEGK